VNGEQARQAFIPPIGVDFTDLLVSSYVGILSEVSDARPLAASFGLVLGDPRLTSQACRALIARTDALLCLLCRVDDAVEWSDLVEDLREAAEASDLLPSIWGGETNA